MNQISFGVLLFLPTVALAFLLLATLYGPTKAFLAISWVPAVFLLVIRFFRLTGSYAGIGSAFPTEMETVVVWTSLAQALLGCGLLVWAFAKKQDRGMIALATLLSALPLLLTRYNLPS